MVITEVNNQFPMASIVYKGCWVHQRVVLEPTTTLRPHGHIIRTSLKFWVQKFINKSIQIEASTCTDFGTGTNASICMDVGAVVDTSIGTGAGV